jgi:hypothetical protein
LDLWNIVTKNEWAGARRGATEKTFFLAFFRAPGERFFSRVSGVALETID